MRRHPRSQIRSGKFHSAQTHSPAVNQHRITRGIVNEVVGNPNAHRVRRFGGVFTTKAGVDGSRVHRLQQAVIVQMIVDHQIFRRVSVILSPRKR